MHHALQIVEIQRMICDQLATNPRDSDSDANDRATLFALALTCRVWVEPALDKLWEYLDSVHPLLKSLPKDLWRSESGWGWHFGRDFLETDGEILQKYSGRVRFLQLNCDREHLRNIPSVMSRLPFPLFPNLRTLYICAEDAEDLGSGCFWRVFLSPTIKYLNITSQLEFGSDYSSQDLSTSILWALDTLCSNVKEYGLFTYGDEIAAAPPLSKVLGQWRHLEALKTTVLDVQTMLHLSSLRSLTSLFVRIHANTVNTLSGTIIVFPPTLTSFAICMDAGGLDRFVSFFAGLHLAATSVEITIPYCQFFLGRLFMLLTTNLSNERLQSFTLNWVSGVHQSGHLDLHAIRPLFGFRLLHTLDLGGHSTHSLGDAAMAEFASSFPLLEVLRLGNENPEGHPGITHLTIVSLLTACPKLRTLCITFDARHITTTWMSPYDALNTRIRTVDVGYSLISDPAPVAMFLKTIMPRLYSVTSPCRSSQRRTRKRKDAAEVEKWEMVSSELADLDSAMAWAEDHINVI
ncbi:hypothetical protein HYDPIDRAFT_170630 [Hydnomerulius pinastri MD-312]|uniref:F-box domain-containing protein n=1 Tax=Hydnomerulius pinastri MD-312 TaxID=994086 RepID=A0A0C9V385_9AGAM|nr:hypothetical protein HYDPIDRAFT_170630 [Hydnomerulius pinastri MD-312]